LVSSGCECIESKQKTINFVAFRSVQKFNSCVDKTTDVALMDLEKSRIYTLSRLQKTPCGAKGSNKFHIKTTELNQTASCKLLHKRAQTHDLLLEDIARG
jgi:hypothetical protein